MLFTVLVHSRPIQTCNISEVSAMYTYNYNVLDPGKYSTFTAHVLSSTIKCVLTGPVSNLAYSCFDL